MATFFEARKHCHTWDEMATLCKRVVDKLGMPVDEDIFEMVVVCNLLGLVTAASCAGHDDHGTFAPYIDFHAPDGQDAEQAERDAWMHSEQLREQGASPEIFVAARGLVWPLQRQAQMYQLAIRSQLLEHFDAFYAQHSVSSDQRLALQYHKYSVRLESQGAGLQNGRTEEERVQKRKIYQEEMASFSAFLKQIWFSQEQHADTLLI